MDWTKIKTKHFLYTKISNSEAGALAKCLLICAAAESIPDRKILIQHVGKRDLKKLELYLSSVGVVLELVLKKVVEDCEKVQKERLYSKHKMREIRIRNKNVRHNVSITHDNIVIQQRREEKIRNTNTISDNTDKDLLVDWKKIESAYPNKASISNAMRAFFDFQVHDIQGILQAIENYKKHLNGNSWKKPMNLERFLQEYDSWVGFSEKPLASVLVKKEPNKDCKVCSGSGKLEDGVKCWCW